FATSDEELQQILELQFANLSQNVSEQERLEQGFLSVQHTLEELREISGRYNHIIVKDGGRVVGFALVMLPEYRDSVETLRPMFDMIDEIHFQGRALREYNYFVMGQICIDKPYRGKGLFKGLYYKLKSEFDRSYSLLITEVATKNFRSTAAHRQVGFRSLKKYTAPDGIEWDIVYWDWKEPEI
ncbi:MAG TPA: GNAT family N-acetyltransferase, partial [Cytophagaceae bacterium]